MMDLKSRALSSLLWKLFERGGRALVEFVIQIVMARILAPDDFGALAIMLVFVNIGNVIVQSGLNTALVQDEDVTDEDYSTVFWMSLIISLILFIVVFFAAPTIAAFYDIEHLIWPLRVLALILVINAYNAVQVAHVQRELRFRKIFNATIVSVIVSGVLGISAAALGMGLWALVIQQISYQLCNCIVLAFQVPWKPQFVFEVRRAKTLFRFGWKLLVSGLLDQICTSFSDLVIGKQFTSTQLGFVSQGKKYPQAIGSMLDGAIQPVMLSAVARVQDDVDYVKRLVRRALKTSTFLIMPVMACLGVGAEPLVILLLGEKWLPCVPFMQMYCFSFALLPIHTSNLQALNGMGRSDLFLGLEVIKKTYCVCFILIGALVFQSVYAIVALDMLSGVISTFVNAYPNKKVIGYSYLEQLKDIGPGFCLTAVAIAAALPVALLGLPLAIQLILQIAIMAIVYLGLAKIIHLEAFSYLLDTAKELLGRKNGHSKANSK